MIDLLWIALGGAAGTLLRYGLSLLVRPGAGGFPWATLLANSLGCALFGLIIALIDHQLWIGQAHSRVLLTGFMGGFTTFSSFIFETGTMLSTNRWKMAGANMAVQIVIGFIALYLGVQLGHLIHRNAAFFRA